MKKGLLILILIIILAGAAFVYVTRKPLAPSAPVDSVSGENTVNPTGDAQTYRISQDGSEVTFRIDEELRGKLSTAVGTTNQVGGDIVISGDTVQIGTITINARTFKTDSERRDGAIAQMILKSENPANEFITFKPTFVEQIGEGMVYHVTGDLTISGITKPATLDVSMAISGDTLTGTVEGVLKRSDYRLTIPDIPFVANVADQFPVSAKIVAPKAK